MPPDQIFHKVQVRDDISLETPKKLDQSEKTSTSTSDNTASASTSRNHVDLSDLLSSHSKTPDMELNSEFLRLKHIDNKSHRRDQVSERLALEEDNFIENKFESTKQKGQKSVRFNLKEQPPTRSKVIHRKGVSSFDLKPSLKKESRYRSYDSSRLMIENNCELVNELSPEPELIAPHLLSDYKNRASSISNATQFWDFWRSFKKEQDTQEWILREIGPSKFKTFFSKGIESDTFWSIFEVVR